MVTFLDFLGALFLIATAILMLLVVIKLIKSYRQKKQRDVLYFIIAFIFALTSSAVLTSIVVMVTITLTFNPAFLTDPVYGVISLYGYITGVTATILALIFINIFSFNTTFPERTKPLTALVVICGTLFVVVLSYALFSIPFGTNLANSAGTYIYYAPLVLILAAACILPTTVSGPALFFYYSVKQTTISKGKSRRSFIFGLSFLLINLSFVLGILTGGNDFLIMILSIISKSFSISGAIGLYLCVYTPNWFKNLIKLSEPL